MKPYALAAVTPLAAAALAASGAVWAYGDRGVAFVFGLGVWLAAEIVWQDRLTREPDTTAEPYIEPEPYSPPQYVRQAYSSTTRALVAIDPPIPNYVDWRQMRRLAWGLLRDNKRLTFAEWRYLFHRDSQYKPLAAWLAQMQMTRERTAGHRQGGVELTGRGRDWLESIITLHGPPPRNKTL